MKRWFELTPFKIRLGLVVTAALVLWPWILHHFGAE